MIRVDISKDVRDIKDKTFKFFSLREGVYLGLGAATTFFVKGLFFSEVSLGSREMALIAFVCFIPFVIGGFFKIHKIPLFRFIANNYDVFLSPVDREYSTGIGEKRKPRKVKKTRKKALQMIK